MTTSETNEGATTPMSQHKHYDLARRAYEGVSFSPERRAVDACAELDRDLDTLRERGADDATLLRCERLWLAMMGSKSRIVSPMIAGPSNFPVRQMQKRNESYDRRVQEYIAFMERTRARLDRAAGIASGEIATAIDLTSPDAVARYDEKIARLEGELAALLARRAAKERIEHYEIPYARRAIKVAQEQRARAVAIAAALAAPPEPITFPGGELFIDDQRVQFSFESRIGTEQAAALKRRGFKWSPSRKTWVRAYNANAWAVAKSLIDAVKGEA